MPSANDLRKGMAIKYNNDVCVVLDMQHRTPGNLRAFVQATLRSLKTGKSSNVRFASTESIEVVSKNTKPVDFSFKDQAGYHFMDPETYETITLNDEFVGDSKNYLTENLRCTLTEVEGKVAELELPPPSNSRSSKPLPASAAIPPPTSPSKPKSKPASKSPSPSSSTPAIPSASTPAPANT